MGKSKKLYLVDKTTGKIVQDDNGNDIVKTTEWEPEATQGSIDVELPVLERNLPEERWLYLKRFILEMP